MHPYILVGGSYAIIRYMYTTSREKNAPPPFRSSYDMSGKSFKYDCLHETNRAKKPHPETAKQQSSALRGKKCWETFRPRCAATRSFRHT